MDVTVAARPRPSRALLPPVTHPPPHSLARAFSRARRANTHPTPGPPSLLPPRTPRGVARARARIPDRDRTPRRTQAQRGRVVRFSQLRGALPAPACPVFRLASMPLLSRFKSKGAQPAGRKKAAAAAAAAAPSDGTNGLPVVPAKPRWTASWDSAVVELDEVQELIHACTVEMKTRGMFPFIPARPSLSRFTPAHSHTYLHTPTHTHTHTHTPARAGAQTLARARTCTQLIRPLTWRGRIPLIYARARAPE